MKSSRWLLGLLSLSMLSISCLWRPKPYAQDPLIRGRRAVLGVPAEAPRGPGYQPEPIAPSAAESDPQSK